MIHRAIEEFGQRMGLPELRLSEKGVAALDVRGLGLVHLERVHDGQNSAGAWLRLCLSRPVAAHEAKLFRKALELCHYEHGHALPLAAGLHGDRLVLFTWLTERALHGAALENAVRFLAEMADRVFQGGQRRV